MRKGHQDFMQGTQAVREKYSNVDWENVRIQAAIAFGQSLIDKKVFSPSLVAENAVAYANALVEELKK